MKKIITLATLGCISLSSLAEAQYVKTTDNAYLQYGNGGDRLGGSKIGFVDNGITLRVIETNNDLYKVALSDSRWAYIPKEYTVPTTDTTTTVNTGSWSIADQGSKDRITVSLPRRLAYRSYTLLEPSTIVVELYGATDNSNWISQRTPSLGMVDYVTFNQVESDVYQIVIRLKSKYQWGYKIGYNGNSFTIDVRHTPEKLDLKHLTIGLDAGHGGEYPGARSVNMGLLEKDVNLDIILRLQKLLEKEGAKVVLTRSGDTGPSMAERKKIWRDANVDIAVSVHNNSGGSPTAKGTSTYYKHLFCRPLAETVLNRMLETGLPLFGLVGNFNFSLNGPPEFPNVLVEGMFMSNPDEEKLLADPKFRQKVAEKIFAGLKDYLKQVKSAK
ncbi:MAG: N-acetylmuramoyl-L-alanine amidase [Muribaculaceae bacterium]|nr:N-acetylmuramoyl-L-alanine amidase [Muribaculaceae bacterium]